MDVLGSTRPIFDRSRFVRTDAEAIARWAATVDPDAIRLPTQPHELMPRVDPERLANLVLLLDSLNFCFWTTPPWLITYRGRKWGRYYALVAGLVRAVEADRSWYKAAWWKCVTRDDLAEVFRGDGEIPMLNERAAIVREIGCNLSETYGGSFLKLLEAAGYDAAEIARTLARTFPSFADRAECEGQTVWILKRAQICAADIAVAMKAAGGPEITGLERLTAFADYRLPQALRHLGIMRLEQGLEERIERGDEIPAGSREEIELRVHTIHGVERMHQALAARGIEKAVWLIDEWLWQRSHEKDVEVQHHRTRTIWY
ncbi:MAG: queuosine 5'-phosphate N-glycosylase/hydrolase [Phycisphaerae bacterium]